MKATYQFMFVLLTAALASACGGPDEAEVDQAAIFGSDACKNTDIKITNNFEVSGSARKIKVLSVEYYSASEGRWLSEDLANTDISAGSSHWWYDEDLQYAENDLITKFKVHFKYDEFDGDWSDEQTHTDDTTDKDCYAGTNFYLDVE
jgi:hypothetical protein